MKGHDMIINQKQTTIAYRCPSCGAIVKSMVGVFSLSGDMMRLKCPCGGSEMTVLRTQDKKMRLTVPCFLCPSPHNYTVSESVFFERDQFAFACPYSGLDICFTGKPENVDRMTAEADAVLTEMLGDKTLADVKEATQGSGVFTDPQIFDIVMYVIRDLDEAGEITCKCADEGDYEAEILDDAVEVRCKKCGAKATVPAGSTLAANAFLHTDHLTLT